MRKLYFRLRDMLTMTQGVTGYWIRAYRNLTTVGFERT